MHGGHNPGSPNSDARGNRAWQQAMAELAIVQAAEMRN